MCCVAKQTNEIDKREKKTFYFNGVGFMIFRYHIHPKHAVHAKGLICSVQWAFNSVTLFKWWICITRAQLFGNYFKLWKNNRRRTSIFQRQKNLDDILHENYISVMRIVVISMYWLLVYCFKVRIFSKHEKAIFMNNIHQKPMTDFSQNTLGVSMLYAYLFV